MSFVWHIRVQHFDAPKRVLRDLRQTFPINYVVLDGVLLL
jgi:hypothetical protein